MRLPDNPGSTDVDPNRATPEVAMQLRKLLLALGHQGSQHLMEVDADLRQTSYLLDEAITKLGKNFLGMHAATMAQQALLATLEEGTPVSAAMRQKFDLLQQEAAGCVSAAVTALQFQDMTNQLIGRVVGHVASLHQVLQEAGDAGESMSCSSGSKSNDNHANSDNYTQALAVLALVNKMLEERATILDKVPAKAVAQTHLESGDIELF
ncbi:MAG: chemotaxis protein [Pseudomonadota bacterium]